MYVLNTALHSESVSNQMIPAIGHVSQGMSLMQFQSGLLAHSTKQLAVPHTDLLLDSASPRPRALL